MQWIKLQATSRKLQAISCSLWLVACLYGQVVFAQVPAISKDSLYAHLSFLTADSLLGRGTGEASELRAAEYLQTRLQQYGVQAAPSGYRQPFAIGRRKVTVNTLTIGNKTFIQGEDFLSSTTDFSTHPLRNETFVYAGFGLTDEHWNDYEGLDVKGKIVVISPGVQSSLGAFTDLMLYQKIGNAYRMGAKAVFYIQPLLPWPNKDFAAIQQKEEINLAGVPEGGAGTYFLQISPGVAAAIFGKTRLQQLEKGADAHTSQGAWAVKPLATRVRFKEVSDTAYNIIGMVPGAGRKHEYVVVSAHYDHLGEHLGKIYHGADDNGSGTAALLELARILAAEKKAGRGPDRTVVFCFFSGEESGLLGSSYYTGNPLFPLDSTVCCLNMDMISRQGSAYKGNKDSLNYIFLVGDDKVRSGLPGLLDKVNEQGVKLVTDRRYNSPDDFNLFVYRSDHLPFITRNVPAVWFFNGEHADYHLESDTMEHIQWELFLRRATYVRDCVFAAAMSDLLDNIKR
jgi:Peptidase family M28